MKWLRYDGRRIEVRQSLWIPCLSKLKAALDRTERKSKFMLTTQLGSGYGDGACRDMIVEATAQIGAKE
jgi:hypothetical protein